MTPVEERIDHEDKRIDFLKWIRRIANGTATDADWEHFDALSAREQRIDYFVNLYPSFKDYFRDHFLPATEPAQPEEERHPYGAAIGTAEHLEQLRKDKPHA